MKRLKFALEQRGRIEDEMQSIADTCERENRSRTPDEKKKYDALKEQLSGMADEIKFLEEQNEAAARAVQSVFALAFRALHL